MKTALLISGWPRFHAEFDEQLANLNNSDFEWIVTLWKNFPQDVDFTLNACLTPSYIDAVKTEDDARAWFLARMPLGHKLAHLSFVDWNDFPSDMVKDYPNQVPGTNPEAIFRQFWMLQHVNSVSKSHGPYDLVVRCRGDVAMSNSIDLAKIHTVLKDDPMQLIVPSNHRQGLAWSDLFTVCTPQAMDIYADAVNHFNDFYNRGVTMHPENIVSHVLRDRGLYWNDLGIQANIRQRGKYLTPHFIKGERYYEPDFGRW